MKQDLKYLSNAFVQRVVMLSCNECTVLCTHMNMLKMPGWSNTQLYYTMDSINSLHANVYKMSQVLGKYYTIFSLNLFLSNIINKLTDSLYISHIYNLSYNIHVNTSKFMLLTVDSTVQVQSIYTVLPSPHIITRNICKLSNFNS